jgi:hypothetical protein
MIKHTDWRACQGVLLFGSHQGREEKSLRVSMGFAKSKDQKLAREG